jgi:hypothetical protein
MNRCKSIRALRPTLIAVRVLAAIAATVPARHRSTSTSADGFGWGKVAAATLVGI